MKVSVVSACYGDYDLPKPPTPQDTEHEVSFTMVTDGPVWPGWDTVVETRPHLHRNVAAKVPKCRPDMYSAEGTDYTVWIDAGAHFGPDLVDRVLAGNPVVSSVPHVPNHHIADEVRASRGMMKYAPLPLEQQMAHYLAMGFPEDHRIWTTGVLGRPVSPFMSAVGNAWLAEIIRWGFQDQLSHPYILWRMGITPTELPVGIADFTPHVEKPF